MTLSIEKPLMHHLLRYPEPPNPVSQIRVILQRDRTSRIKKFLIDIGKEARMASFFFSKSLEKYSIYRSVGFQLFGKNKILTAKSLLETIPFKQNIPPQ